MGLDSFWKRIGLCVGLAGWLVIGNLAEVSAQTDPAGFATVINNPPTIFPPNSGIGSNTQLNIFDDPAVRFDVGTGFNAGSFLNSSTNIEVNLYDGEINFNFSANSGSTVNILGGLLGLRSRANSGSVVNISGGRVSANFDANSGSEVNISGGFLGLGFDANAGSVVNVTGGVLDNDFRARSGSEVNISGGSFGPCLEAFSDSEVNISGGNFGDRIDARPGNVTFYGGEFLLDGEVPSNLDSFTLPEGSVLTGTLEDGSVFVFSSIANFSSDSLSGVTLQPSTLPANDLTPQSVSSAAGQTIGGLRAGQSLTLENGGLLNSNFSVVDATLEVLGGEMGSNLRLVNSVANISGGTVGNDGFLRSGLNAYAGSTVNISQSARILGPTNANSDAVLNILGGTLDEVSARSGSVVNVSGGSFRSLAANDGSEVLVSGGTPGRMDAGAGSRVEVTGGTWGPSFSAEENSEVTISGGTFGSNFEAEIGSDVTIRGGEFLLNGMPLANPTGAPVTLNQTDVLTGTLEDGSVFIFSDLWNRDELSGVTLETAPLPPVSLIPFVVVDAAVIPPAGLRAGEALTLRGDGSLGQNFSTILATLNIEGGSVAPNTEVESSTVTVSGGELTGSLIAYSGSEISFSEGDLNGNLVLFDSSAEISGGSLGGLSVSRNSVAELTGGTIGSDELSSLGTIAFFTVISLSDGGILDVSGGNINGDFYVDSESQLNLFVSQAFIDGVEIGDLMPGVERTILDRNAVLSGSLADGSDFSILLADAIGFPAAFTEDLFLPGSTLTVTLVSEPDILLGDVNRDSEVNFFDITPFISALGPNAEFQAEADCNEDGVVNFLDIQAFIDILTLAE